MTDIKKYSLVRPTADLEAEYRAFANDLEASGDGRWSIVYRDLGYEGFLARREREARGEDMEEGRVQQSIFWLIDESQMIHGEMRFRPKMNERVKRESGNIGYVIRSSSRRQGLGTEILRLAKEEARSMGLDRVLLICEDDNAGSIRVIEANGGSTYERTTSDRDTIIRRYWIGLS